MSKKSFIDSVKVKDPCTEDWEQMRGNERVRFCSHCSKHVNNLSEMTRKEAMRLVRASSGNLCIRYVQNPKTKRPMFAEQLLQITRRAPGLAAGMMTVSISLSTAVYSQSESTSKVPAQSVVRLDEKKISTPPQNDQIELKANRLASITGSVTDQMGAVIPGARVTILGVSEGKNETTLSNDDGSYRFEKLEPGRYWIQWEAQGFQKGEAVVDVYETERRISDASLEVAQLALTVDVVANVEVSTEVSGGIGIAIEYSLPLNSAVAKGDLKQVRKLLHKGANVNGKDENHDEITPLFVAVEHRNVEIVQLLLDFGSSVNATDHDGDTALMVAARNSTTEVVQALINAGADVNAANKEGETALITAARYDHLETIDLLLKFGAFVNARNSDGESAWDATSNKDLRALLAGFGAEIRIEEETVETTQDTSPESLSVPTTESSETTPEPTPENLPI